MSKIKDEAVKILIRGVLNRQLKKLNTEKTLQDFEREIFQKYNCKECYIEIDFLNNSVNVFNEFEKLNEKLNFINMEFAKNPEESEATKIISEYLIKIFIFVKRNETKINYSYKFKE